MYSYHKQSVFGAGWGIKGHNRPWVISQGQWEPGLRFLDVGAGYSDLAAYLVERYRMEGWVADDFGKSSGNTLWSRWGDPHELPKKHPGVKYVFKCVGEPDSWNEFPKAYFDRIYSVSTLEHIPRERMQDVFAHMNALLKPGGLMIHSVDIPFDLPLEKYISSNFSKHPLVNGFFNLVWHKVSHRPFARYITGGKYYPGTAAGWAHFLKKTLTILSGKALMRTTRYSSVLFDPDVLFEPIDIVFNLYPPNKEPKPFRRNASLLFILKSLPG